MTNSVDPDQTAPIGAVCSGSMLFDSILKLVSNVRQYLQQMTSADVIFQMHFFLALKGLIHIISIISFLTYKLHCCMLT